MRNFNESTITDAVIERIRDAPNARVKEISASLIRHLHDFVRDVRLTEAEWVYAIDFLTRTGKTCDGNRQEFILLSDTLGVSMVVDLINHRKPEGATESTVFGPFHRDGAPEMPPGGNIASRDDRGTPMLISGRVLDLSGHPIAGAQLDVWQADSSGMYDSQYADRDELHMRGRFRADAAGRYLVRTVRPVHYQIPHDGPVGQMLRATNRHPWRPAHVHFVVSANGYEPVTTHLFDDADPYLDSDTVFAVKDSLICHFTRHDAHDQTSTALAIEPPFYRVAFDFVLKPRA